MADGDPVLDIQALARESDDFRREVRTTERSQIVLMTIPVGEDIGEEVHPENDQWLGFVEGDADHPRMASIVNPARKLQGDNPDAIYHFAQIHGDRAYRVFGVRGEESYISFTVHSEAADGGFNGRVLADINDSQFTFAPDGSYEIVFSADKPADGGNWVQLDPDARMLIVRSYFLRAQSAQNDPLVQVRIESSTAHSLRGVQQPPGA